MLTVYHGSVLTIDKPLAKAGRLNLDFGQGFYITDIRKQAKRWALRIGVRFGEKPWSEYDVVEGGVANDRVIDTVEAYMIGNMTVEMALGQLAQHQPNNQICLLNQEVINEHLCFMYVEQVKEE